MSLLKVIIIRSYHMRELGAKRGWSGILRISVPRMFRSMCDRITTSTSSTPDRLVKVCLVVPLRRGGRVIDMSMGGWVAYLGVGHLEITNDRSSSIY